MRNHQVGEIMHVDDSARDALRHKLVEHAIGQRAANVVQKQRRTELALHVATADDFADIAIRCTIDQFSRKRKLAIVENADDDARAPLLLGASAFYGKFHRRSRLQRSVFLP